MRSRAIRELLRCWITEDLFLIFRIQEHLISPSVFSGVRVTRSLVLYVCVVDRSLSFYICWSLCCLFFFDIRNRITPLVSSNSSYYTMITYYFKINPLWFLRAIVFIISTMFVSSLPPVVCSRAHVLFTLSVLVCV